MSTVSHNSGIDRALNFVTSRACAVALTVLSLHVLSVLLYVHVTQTVIAPERAMIPIIWIGFSVWFVTHIIDHGVESSRSTVAVVVGLGYVLLLAAVSGLIGLATHASGLTVELATPGWGPIVLYSVGAIQLAIVPFELIGYLALSYGVYRAIDSTSRGAVAGVFGLFACIGCTVPLIGAVLSIGTGSTVALQPGASTYNLATGVFILTVVTLAVAIPTQIE